ncbi:hypothetical protein F0562_012987 [Nyssa sinensis]|uniref:Uncharacterized protein n=1 Tax=Nyssa sinensis TaxID=561372 RepID=A0A5J4ZWQ2_9ASTE|nr:hypothetical protein F0562_012987 [Nyssa sinensis]
MTWSQLSRMVDRDGESGEDDDMTRGFCTMMRRFQWCNNYSDEDKQWSFRVAEAEAKLGYIAKDVVGHARPLEPGNADVVGAAVLLVWAADWAAVWTAVLL